ncbi:TerB N-terminal domain-containing protein [Brenneria goodwinii]|uniref:Probable membrane protein YPO2297 n=1 Tax=Brenneria goodwinii TaxID=1109412 RepID=A0A0G4JYL6_9GAMM|nr:TerB N-terminal domain-containing protein [Brenneria goodwinii]MCG8154972.1 TerB N-terminal domain-containing protein [Brenneria goodwinii]MCG8162815.1 TerB N-terminal domain-containing protein [Brenneria goodwinii]MCG8164210.1 TerB N-terminal domain-containing protein [Brenneria goodwinii]MCG8168819.1 TerB N-terminal domain-containing protein [Brenneria goodwinii]MCG8173626.1 TerB N-terminal domain-containing protein [Brenneria goodwinii]
MELWILIAAIYVIYLLFFKKKNNKPAKSHASKTVKAPPNEWLADIKKKESVVQKDDSEDDDLATFTLSSGRNVEYRAATIQRQNLSKTTGTLARWVLPGEVTIVGGVEITGGYFYLGQRMKHAGQSLSGDDDGTEASLIDDTLKIYPKPYIYEDSSLGYWPSYSSLSPDARGAYLSWLASDRRDASCPVGYVFIYLYGLERKALVDSRDGNTPDAEFLTLFNEVCRLRSVFIENRSFRNYSSQLLEAMSILRPQVGLVPNPGSDSDYSSGGMQFKLALAKAVDAGVPVSAELALKWVINHTEYALRTPARRCAKEFAALFKRRYTLKYGEGMVVKPNKTRLRLDYTPASPSLRGVRLPVPDLPDPRALKGPAQKIMTLAEICTDELDAYSRYLGRKGTSENDTAAIILLPVEIINESAGKVLNTFKRWADEVIASRKGLTTVADFWVQMGANCPAKINKKEADMMQAFALKMGYCLAPDPFYHHMKAEADGALVLFSASEGARLSPSPAFISAVMTLRLGSMVALTDNSLDQAEQKVLENAIDHNSGFNEDEKRSLHAYLTWQLHTPANVTGMKNRIAPLSAMEKSAVGKVIVGVACSDGRIEPAEIKQLEKIYLSLGLDPSTISGNIHQHSTAEVTPLSSASTNPGAAEFTLDASVLAHHESATDDVRKLLSAIFTEEEPEFRESAPVTGTQDGGLDNAHSQLYHRLLEKKQWPRKEATALCENLNLMLSGALEVINDWSYAVVDAPVLDDADDDIWVDQEIAKELEG